MNMPFPTLLLALPLLAGCTLIDQRTFTRTPPAPTVAEAARATLPARPLVSIRFPVADPGWPAQVADAIAAAQSRRPDAQFDILAAMPLTAPETATQAALQQGEADARAVSEALSRQGVPPDRLHLGLQGDAGTPAREVRIYIR
jgi:hypothetical protein